MKKSFWNNGYGVVEEIYSREELSRITHLIKSQDKRNPRFRRNSGLFAVRNFLNEFPELSELLWNDKLVEVIDKVGGEQYQNVKSIYFDKPPNSNWVVSWHQDLTISVNRRINYPGYKNWTLKSGLAAVQPPISVLENNFTIRIHIDPCSQKNGALNIIPKSHFRGILEAKESLALVEKETPISCEVGEGGIMLMHPLLLHSSRRTENDMNRRVIHLEFSKSTLAGELEWRELSEINRKKKNSA